MIESGYYIGEYPVFLAGMKSNGYVSRLWKKKAGKE